MVKESVHSEETLREIDLEVKRLVDEGYRTAFEILTSHKAVLEHLSAELFETETMNADQMHKIIDQHSAGPKIAAGTSVTVVNETAAEQATISDDVPDVASGPAG